MTEKEKGNFLMAKASRELKKIFGPNIEFFLIVKKSNGQPIVINAFVEFDEVVTVVAYVAEAEESGVFEELDEDELDPTIN